MVLTVIAVYVICWLPYWLFQITMLYFTGMPPWLKVLYQLITILSYANSAVNPILYAFLSDNFRRTFARAFRCATAAEVESVLKKTGQLPKSEAMPDDGARRILYRIMLKDRSDMPVRPLIVRNTITIVSCLGSGIVDKLGVRFRCRMMEPTLPGRRPSDWSRLKTKPASRRQRVNSCLSMMVWNRRLVSVCRPT